MSHADFLSADWLPVLTPMLAGSQHGLDTVLILSAGKPEGRSEMGDDTGFLFSEVSPAGLVRQAHKQP